MRIRGRAGTSTRGKSIAADAVGRLLPDAAVEPALRSATRRGGKVVAWVVVVASPLVMLAVLLVLRPTPPPVSQDTGVHQAQRDPSGWAEMYVRAWLTRPAAMIPPGWRSSTRPA